MSVLSNNCLSYFIYKEAKAKYLSPTIATQIPILDFVRFVNNLNYYLSKSLVELDHNTPQEFFTSIGGGVISFPCAKLDDISILFQHEKKYEIAAAKWLRRSKRITDAVAVIYIHDFEIDREIIEAIDSITISKIVLTNSNIVKKGWYQVKTSDGKEWWETSKNGLRYFEKMNWNKMLKEALKDE